MQKRFTAGTKQTIIDYGSSEVKYNFADVAKFVNNFNHYTNKTFRY
jgi:hypothetical protein